MNSRTRPPSFDVPCGDCGGATTICGGDCGHVDSDAR